jgi:hypothetical protein
MPALAVADLRIGCLLAYLAVAYVAFIALGALPSDKAPGRRPALRVLADRLAFVLAFAILPIVAFRAMGAGLPGLSALGAGEPSRWLGPCAALCVLGGAIGFLSRKGSADIANYPQYLPPRWNAGSLALEIGSWAAYLLAYEFAFRGIFLACLLPAGAYTAVAAETALYAFAHLPKSVKEAAGAVGFGIVASLLTLAFGTLYPAFLIHLALALANDLGCRRAARRARPS